MRLFGIAVPLYRVISFQGDFVMFPMQCSHWQGRSSTSINLILSYFRRISRYVVLMSWQILTSILYFVFCSASPIFKTAVSFLLKLNIYTHQETFHSMTIKRFDNMLNFGDYSCQFLINISVIYKRKWRCISACRLITW